MIVSRREFCSGMCCCAATWLAGCATTPEASRTDEREFVEPGYRPPAESDERGLWSLAERQERELAQSRFLIHEAGLNDYLRGLVCRLGGRHCADIRVYVVRTPRFNASMAPNGMMQVWTGLLLRCHDEAQLAAIVGHELGHYLRRHTVENYRSIRDKARFSAFLGLGLAAAGAGWASPLSDLGLLASVFAFNRDQEREADAIGIKLLSDAGYAAIAAAEVWDQMITELKASPAARRNNILFATHPGPEERLGNMRQAAGALGGGGDRGRDRYRARLRPVGPLLLADELNLHQYGRSEFLFDQLLRDQPDDGGLWFAKGEVCRLRSQGEDNKRALDAYDRALATDGAPPETYRSIGLVQLQGGSKEQAREAFATYLRLKPDASDAGAIRALVAP